MSFFDRLPFILFIVLVDIFPAYSISRISPVKTVTPSVIGQYVELKFVEY